MILITQLTSKSSPNQTYSDMLKNPCVVQKDLSWDKRIHKISANESERVRERKRKEETVLCMCEMAWNACCHCYCEPFAQLKNRFSLHFYWYNRLFLLAFVIIFSTLYMLCTESFGLRLSLVQPLNLVSSIRKTCALFTLFFFSVSGACTRQSTPDSYQSYIRH